MSENYNDDSEVTDYTKLQPWNSRDYPITVNSIRYNQDFSLLTLGTSKGFRIFLTSNLKPAHEPTDEVIKLGDISIAMAYYKSSLVFLLPSRFNKNFTNKEIIVFDDFFQTKFATFKNKSEEILNIFVSRNVIFLITLSQIIVLEILSFKIIDIISNTNSINQLLSFNYFNYIAYSDLKDKKNVFVKFYQNEQNRITSSSLKKISFNFDYMQTFQLSPQGNLLAIVSIYGNKIHIYYTQNGKLKDCLYLNSYIQTIEKVYFSEKKSNYFFVLKNDNKFNVYKIGNNQVEIPKCICAKYDDSQVTVQNQDSKGTGIFGYLRRFSKNYDIKDPHAYSEFNGNLLFADFDRTKNKDIILINESGEFIKYHLKKKPCGHISPILTFQWE